MRISGYQIFILVANKPVNLYAKEVTATGNWNAYHLLKKSVTCYRCGVKITLKLVKVMKKAEFSILEELHSARMSNRKNRLEKLVCQKYFSSDLPVPGKYFGCGNQ